MSKKQSLEVRFLRRMMRQQRADEKRNRPLIVERLKDLLRYDQATGYFIRVVCQYHPELIGKPTGSILRHGYVQIVVDGKKYTAHRLAFFYMTGEWPPEDVDHINGVRKDNRWVNLRLASRSENMENLRGPSKRNKTGFLGVSPHGPSFRAEIGVKGVKVALGVFPTAEAASEAYQDAKRRLHVRAPA